MDLESPFWCSGGAEEEDQDLIVISTSSRVFYIKGDVLNGLCFVNTIYPVSKKKKTTAKTQISASKVQARLASNIKIGGEQSIFHRGRTDLLAPG